MYKENFGDNPYCDISKFNPEEIPDFNILCAGFPCQAFSIAGNKNGFNDTRGTLFFDLCRIIDIKKPDVLLLENVKNLLNHDNGNTFNLDNQPRLIFSPYSIVLIASGSFVFSLYFFINIPFGLLAIWLA